MTPEFKVDVGRNDAEHRERGVIPESGSAGVSWTLRYHRMHNEGQMILNDHDCIKSGLKQMMQKNKRSA